MRPDLDEIDIKTLIPSTKTTFQAVTAEIFEVDAPSLVLGQIGREIVLRGGRPFADFGDVQPDLDRQDVDVMGIPWIVAADPASGSSSDYPGEQKRACQQASVAGSPSDVGGTLYDGQVRDGRAFI